MQHLGVFSGKSTALLNLFYFKHFSFLSSLHIKSFEGAGRKTKWVWLYGNRDFASGGLVKLGSWVIKLEFEIKATCELVKAWLWLVKCPFNHQLIVFGPLSWDSHLSEHLSIAESSSEILNKPRVLFVEVSVARTTFSVHCSKRNLVECFCR